MFSKNIKIALVIVLILVGAFFFFESDESYLKKKTVFIVESLSLKIPMSDIGMIRKTNEIIKHIDISVEFKVRFDKRIFVKKSLAQLRGLLFQYFKKAGLRGLEKVKKDQLTVQIISKGKPKRALVLFPLSLKWDEKIIQCQVELNWVKEKKWLISKVEALSCLVQ